MTARAARASARPYQDVTPATTNPELADHLATMTKAHVASARSLRARLLVSKLVREARIAPERKATIGPR